jgi:hypothetical protein
MVEDAADDAALGNEGEHPHHAGPTGKVSEVRHEPEIKALTDLVRGQ